MLVAIYGDYGTGAITPPSGWTLVKRIDSGTAQNMAVYWGLGSASFTAWTIPGPTSGAVAFTLGYTGVDNTTPMDTTAAGQVNTSSTTGTAPSVTTVTDNAWGVCFFGFMNSETFTDTSPLVHRQSGTLTGHGKTLSVSLDGADFVQAAHGATGTHTTTGTTAAINIGVTAALRPGVGATALRMPLLGVGP